MIKSFTYRLWTNKNSERELARTLETHRRIYNKALEGVMLCWETAGVQWRFYEQSNWLTIQRRLNPRLAAVNAAAAVQTLRRLDKAYSSYFRRKAHPVEFVMPPRPIETTSLLFIATLFAAILSMRTETDGRPWVWLLAFWTLVGFVVALRSLWRRWRAPRRFGRG